MCALTVPAADRTSRTKITPQSSTLCQIPIVGALKTTVRDMLNGVDRIATPALHPSALSHRPNDGQLDDDVRNRSLTDTGTQPCTKIRVYVFRTYNIIRTSFSNIQERDMSRTFAYARVSTTDQTAANQLREIEAAGFNVDKRRVVTESISGSVSADQRPGFAELLLKMEEGDVLIVTKLDRLGRNAMDVRATVETLADRGIRIHCLALGGVDLTSAAGRMTMQVLNAVAEFERDLLIERTQAGIARAKAEGKAMGRPSALSKQQQNEVRNLISEGATIAGLAKQYGTSRQTIMRVRDSMQASTF